MTLALDPGTGEPRLHPDLAPGGAEPESDPVQVRVAFHLGTLRAEDPRVLAQALGGDVAEVGAGAHPDLRDRVEERIRVGVGGQPLLPHLRLGALLEHDQRAEGEGRRLGILDRCDQRRRLEALASRHVDERSAVPGAVVACNERIVARRQRPEHLAEVGKALERALQGGDQRFVRAPIALDLHRRPFDGRAIHLDDQVICPLRRVEDPVRTCAGLGVAAGGGRVGVEVEVGEVRELPAARLLRRQRRCRAGVSQSNPPSAARSGG